MDRTRFFESLGADRSAAGELAAYCDRRFEPAVSGAGPIFPVPPEPHVATWRHYAEEAERIGVFPALQRRIVHLRFPIRAGISLSAAYRAATRRGVPTGGMYEASGLQLLNPDELQLLIRDSLAGPIPVLIASGRDDFVALLRALTSRNEPVPIPESMGAMMVANFNNWDRILTMREKWLTEHPNDISGEAWECEFRDKVVPNKTSYQDKFIILSDGPYSGVAAAELGIAEDEWRRLSVSIRLEHECTHYFTKRVLGSMQGHLLDELIADYRGIVAATGRYRSDWFLRFMGLENYPDYRRGGRLENYRGNPPLSDKAFRVLQTLVKLAAQNVERFDREHADKLTTLQSQIRELMALCGTSLDVLASSDARPILESALQ